MHEYWCWLWHQISFTRRETGCFLRPGNTYLYSRVRMMCVAISSRLCLGCASVFHTDAKRIRGNAAREHQEPREPIIASLSLSVTILTSLNITWSISPDINFEMCCQGQSESCWKYFELSTKISIQIVCDLWVPVILLEVCHLVASAVRVQLSPMGRSYLI